MSEMEFVEEKLTLSSVEGITRELHLFHIKDPKKSQFSQKKKQCDLWEYVWGSSFLLSSLLLKVKSQLTDLNVLEIGGGHGVCSLICAMSKSNVVMTDLVVDALELCKKSAEKNECLEKMTFKKLDWNKLETVDDSMYDLVIGSDILFFRGCVKPVAETIKKALKPGGVALVADPCRLNEEDFLDALIENKLTASLFDFKDEIVELVGSTLKDNEVVKVKKAKLLVITKPIDKEESKLKKEIDKVIHEFVEPKKNY